MFPSAQMPSSWLALDLLTSLRSSRCASLRSLGSSMRPFYSTVHNIKGAGPLLSTATSISGLAAELVSVSAPATRGYCGREMPWLEVKSRPPGRSYQFSLSSRRRPSQHRPVVFTIAFIFTFTMVFTIAFVFIFAVDIACFPQHLHLQHQVCWAGPRTPSFTSATHCPEGYSSSTPE